jgi:hypothetical protein
MEIKEREDGTFKLNEKQALKKDKKGKFRMIFPYKMDGKILWSNVFKFDWTIVFLLLGMLLLIYNYSINIEECLDIVQNPEEHCKEFHPIYNGGLGGDIYGKIQDEFSGGENP